jgi:hypothetical protein
MHRHMSLRDRLEAHATHGHEPTFEVTADPALLAFASLFVESGFVVFHANKHQRTDAWTPLYECWTELQRDETMPVERFEVSWAPVWQRADPVTGFRTGWDSALFGSTSTIAMPQDERTAALLMLVTTNFVHLSASWEDSGLLIRGAVDVTGPDYRYLVLDPTLVAIVTARVPLAGPHDPEKEGVRHA